MAAFWKTQSPRKTAETCDFSPKNIASASDELTVTDVLHVGELFRVRTRNELPIIDDCHSASTTEQRTCKIHSVLRHFASVSEQRTYKFTLMYWVEWLSLRVRVWKTNLQIHIAVDIILLGVVIVTPRPDLKTNLQIQV